MKDFVLRPNIAYYYQCILANAHRCARDWHIDLRDLSIHLGQSASCRGHRNNYEIRSTSHKRAYNGANHELDGVLGNIGYDEDELTSAYSFADIEGMMKSCLDYRGPR